MTPPVRPAATVAAMVLVIAAIAISVLTARRGPDGPGDTGATEDRRTASDDLHGAPEWMPDASNTGVPDGVTLEPHAGTLTVTTDGTVIDGLDIDGCLLIKADNVTIRNTRIRCADTRALYAPTGYGPTLVEHVEVAGVAEPWSHGVVGHHMTVRHTDIHGFGDGVKLWTGSTYEHNYIHDLAVGDGQHNDGMQMSGGHDVVIRNNRIVHDPTQTSAILIKADVAPIYNLTIDGNWLEGGNYTLYLLGQGDDSTGGSTPYRAYDITAVNNRFGDHAHGPLLAEGLDGNFTWDCNVWDDTGELMQPDGHPQNGTDCNTRPATSPTPVRVRRLGGADRVATSIAVSEQSYGSSNSVILARQDVYADALTAGPLAAEMRAPILLTSREEVDPRVIEEIDRLGAREAVLIGGGSALGPSVAEDLRSHGLAVRRIAGSSRFATAGAIATELDVTDVVLTEGAHQDPARGWPDALSAAGLASHEQMAVLLVTRTAVPDATATALRGRARALIVGG